ncbi:MAG: hypothetical protein LBI39_01810 [Puniceicoccales bacterium]|nr:hypothetical protein [Puniceicoccales bacterium]
MTSHYVAINESLNSSCWSAVCDWSRGCETSANNKNFDAICDVLWRIASESGYAGLNRNGKLRDILHLRYVERCK